MLTERDIEVLEYMDYQVMNNGMDGWLGNRAYDKMFEFLKLLHKRNSELDQKVAAIFIKVIVSGLGYYQHQSFTFIPEFKELYNKYEEAIEECHNQYKEVAKDFMNSYGLEDYHTKFMSRFDIK
ncbi:MULTISPECIES: hypothetical protein [Lysinibacillus]|uniref:hypothetical protein n=1 Tax=Lysinibacillus TaxID=400634 RepID=UPI0004D68347|nr:MULTISPECIES: hypothetical protein [Lysinibacillus]AJK88515.1 hypothetical protein HR49_15935 [Lysinibacillus fusiformis]KHK53970.1 hypothetical protein PI85_07060 [Lysinibacillus sp. A1]MEE3809082.1 hypothetical protein [Lysinibacillus fusiformis]